jgi:hypothetical protein
MLLVAHLPFCIIILVLFPFTRFFWHFIPILSYFLKQKGRFTAFLYKKSTKSIIIFSHSVREKMIKAVILETLDPSYIQL